MIFADDCRRTSTCCWQSQNSNSAFDSQSTSTLLSTIEELWPAVDSRITSTLLSTVEVLQLCCRQSKNFNLQSTVEKLQLHCASILLSTVENYDSACGHQIVWALETQTPKPQTYFHPIVIKTQNFTSFFISIVLSTVIAASHHQNSLFLFALHPLVAVTSFHIFSKNFLFLVRSMPHLARRG